MRSWANLAVEEGNSRKSLREQSQHRRNFILGVANGTLVRFHAALADPSLVLAWFVSQLGAPPLVIGLLLPITNGGYFLPQWPASHFLQHQPTKMPFYRIVSLMRLGCWILLTASVFIIGDRNAPLLLVLFLLLYCGFSFGAGLSGLCFMDIVAKAIPAHRRGSFFAWREFTSALLALGGSALARYVLADQQGFAFPTNFGWLFVIAGIALAIGFFLFTRLIEPLEPVNKRTVSCNTNLLSMGKLLLRDRNYTLFISARVLLLSSTVTAPFYSIFAKEKLHAPIAMVGTYLGAFTIAALGSTLPWGTLSSRSGNRMVMWLTGLLSAALPLPPLLLGSRISYAAFTVIFVFLGVIQSGTLIGCLSLLLDIAPAAERVFYIGLLNTVLGIVSFLLMAGGLIVAKWGLNALFYFSSACALLSAFLARSIYITRQKS